MVTADSDGPMQSPPAPAAIVAPRLATSRDIGLLGCGLIFLGLLLAYLLASVWPACADVLKCDEKGAGLRLLWIQHAPLEVSADVRVLLLVMVAGGLGSFIHTATSFADFVGNAKLARSWLWWYVLRPFIGMALAVILYVAVRGGFMSANSGASDLNIFGIAALAGMSGMFAKQATDKLSEVFSSLFRTAPDGGDAQRKDGLGNVAPALSALEPDTVGVGAEELRLVVKGANFVRGSVVRVNGAGRPTTFTDGTRLLVTLASEDVASEGTLELTVVNPPPGGGESAKLALAVTRAAGAPSSTPNPAPDEHADGCDVEILDAMPDEALPAARGGVSTP